ncbi:MAG: DUF2007 domain-containing protein [Planctomycetaceae bacterium]
MSDQNLVEVFRARNAVEAHIVKSALEDAGIRARVTGEMLQGVLGEIPTGWATAPQVLVFEDDAARARELIQEQEELRRTSVHDAKDDETDVDDEGYYGEPEGSVEEA